MRTSIFTLRSFEFAYETTQSSLTFIHSLRFRQSYPSIAAYVVVLLLRTMLCVTCIVSIPDRLL